MKRNPSRPFSHGFDYRSSPSIFSISWLLRVLVTALARQFVWILLRPKELGRSTQESVLKSIYQNRCWANT
ncbi:hypothetical protein LINPERHAP2_LOCUS24677 [Linum perenne]